MSLKSITVCGFAGELRLQANDFSSERLKRALVNTSYRGPDATSIYERNNILIGFNRLSINNLATGDQPRCFKSQYNAEEDSILTFNGEIFNYKELESVYLTTPFNQINRSTSRFTKKMGTDMFSLLNGQFAIAILIPLRCLLSYVGIHLEYVHSSICREIAVFSLL